MAEHAALEHKYEIKTFKSKIIYIKSISDITEHIIRHLVDKNNYTHVVVSSSVVGKDLIPRVAAQYNSQAITDVTSVVVCKFINSLVLNHFYFDYINQLEQRHIRQTDLCRKRFLHCEIQRCKEIFDI